MQTHADFRKEAVFAESLKHSDMMERIDYLYGDRDAVIQGLRYSPTQR